MIETLIIIIPLSHAKALALHACGEAQREIRKYLSDSAPSPALACGASVREN
jgi:hypothetical protein